VLMGRLFSILTSYNYLIEFVGLWRREMKMSVCSRHIMLFIIAILAFDSMFGERMVVFGCRGA